MRRLMSWIAIAGATIGLSACGSLPAYTRANEALRPGEPGASEKPAMAESTPSEPEQKQE